MMQIRRFLLFAGGALFDHDDLAAPVEAAAWANVMRSLHLTAGAASNQVNRRDEDVAAAIALPMTTDALLGKCSHGRSPVLFLVVRPKQ
jgi:hypothetical protein